MRDLALAPKETGAKPLSDEQEEALIEALILYYCGACETINDALTEADGISQGTYYRAKRKDPTYIQDVQLLARKRAFLADSGKQQSYNARIRSASHAVQDEALPGLLKAVRSLTSIVALEPWDFEVPYREEDKGMYIKRILPYPRDVIAAAQILRDIVQLGVLPGPMDPQLQAAIMRADLKEQKDGTMELPLHLGIPASFMQLKARSPDGNSITITRESGDVVDGEIEEDDE